MHNNAVTSKLVVGSTYSTTIIHKYLFFLYKKNDKHKFKQVQKFPLQYQLNTVNIF